MFSHTTLRLSRSKMYRNIESCETYHFFQKNDCAFHFVYGKVIKKTILWAIMKRSNAQKLFDMMTPEHNYIVPYSLSVQPNTCSHLNCCRITAYFEVNGERKVV